MKIMVVDDEKLLVKGITFNLQNEGYEVEAAYDGVTAVDLARRESFDLIILDWMMPGKSGSEACMEIRTFSDVPVIMLTAKSEDSDKIMGFACGADDYVTKPFNPLELTARVKSQLRRYTEFNSGVKEPEENKQKITVRGLEIDKSTHVVKVDGEEIRLTPLEFDILWLLAESPGKVFSTDEIFRRVWNETVYEANNTVMVHIRRLRTKIKDDQRADKIITTVWGVGYKIEQ